MRTCIDCESVTSKAATGHSKHAFHEHSAHTPPAILLTGCLVVSSAQLGVVYLFVYKPISKPASQQASQPASQSASQPINHDQPASHPARELHYYRQSLAYKVLKTKIIFLQYNIIRIETNTDNHFINIFSIKNKW
jgi:hypothetical protein